MTFPAAYIPPDSRSKAFDQLKSIANERDVERTARYVNRDDGLSAHALLDLLNRLLHPAQELSSLASYRAQSSPHLLSPYPSPI